MGNAHLPLFGNPLQIMLTKPKHIFLRELANAVHLCVKERNAHFEPFETPLPIMLTKPKHNF
jgi:hypothetical protein